MSTFTLPLPVVAFLLKPYFRLAFNSRLPYRIQRLLLEAGGAPLQQVPAGAVVRRWSWLADRQRRSPSAQPSAPPQFSTCMAGRTRWVRCPHTVLSQLISPVSRPVRSSPWTTVSRRRIRIPPLSTTRSQPSCSWSPSSTIRKTALPSPAIQPVAAWPRRPLFV